MVIAWLRQLKQTFGVPFLLLVVSVYWTQGFRGFPWTGISYLMKDELKLSPSASQLLTSTAFIPWSIKPVYGVFSDCVYIYGNRRIPYLLLASVLSIVAWATLALSPAVLQSTTLFTTLLICQNVGSAMADVVVDAMVAETAKREREEFAGDLQTLSWFAMAFGGVSGSLTGGPGLKALRPSGMFAVFTIFPVLQFFTCFLLNEKKLLAGPSVKPPSTKMEVETAEKGIITDEGETGGVASLAMAGRSLSQEEDTIKKRKGRRGKGGEGQVGVGNGWHGERALEQVSVMDSETNLTVETEEGWKMNGYSKTLSTTALVNKNEEVTEPGRHSFGSRFTSLDDAGDLDGEEVDIRGGGSRSTRREVQPNEGKQSDNGATNGGSVTNGQGWLGRGGSGRRKGAQKKKKWSLANGDRENEKNGTKTAEEQPHSIVKEFKHICHALWEAVRRPAIVRPLLWFVLSCAAVPSLKTIMFYFHTNALLLDPAFLGTSQVAGWGGLMAGTLLYSAYLKHVPLRRIFLGVHLVMGLVTLGDALLVSRLNLLIGLPDKFFVLLSAVLVDAVNQFRFMPFLILSARLCPPGIEGTLFAVFMSSYNLGLTISGYLGATLASSLGVTAHSFAGLSTGIGIQAVCTLLPVLFLGMIPADATGVSEHDHVLQEKPKSKKRQ